MHGGNQTHGESQTIITLEETHLYDHLVPRIAVAIHAQLGAATTFCDNQQVVPAAVKHRQR